jgi:hypothetical protein
MSLTTIAFSFVNSGLKTVAALGANILAA